jgi:hypothetical protein
VILDILFRLFGLLALKDFNTSAVQSFDSERHLMKAILSVPDEGYSERHLMKVILSVPDEGYSERT